MSDQFERVARPKAALEGSPGPSSRGINRNHLTLLLTVVGVISAAAGAGLATWGMMYRWHGGEQEKIRSEAQKAMSEAGQAQLDARVNVVLDEFNHNPNSHPKLAAEIRKLHADLNYTPPPDLLTAYEELAYSTYAQRFATSALERRKLAADIRMAGATEQNQRQDTEKKKAETGTAQVDEIFAKEVKLPVKPILAHSIKGALTGEMMSVDNSTASPSRPSIGGARATLGNSRTGSDPLTASPAIVPGSANDPLKNKSNIK
jgi:hypothetical protein